VPSMIYDELTRAWRIGYGITGLLLIAGGAIGTLAEVLWGLWGYSLAWIACVLTVALIALGVFLAHAAFKGRIRSLGIGRKPPAA